LAVFQCFADSIKIVHIRSRITIQRGRKLIRGDLMKKRISRRQFISTRPRHGRLGAATLDAGANPVHRVLDANPAWGPGCAGSMRQPSAVAGRHLGHAVARGKQRETRTFALRGADKKAPGAAELAPRLWPDGSLKWTAHACGPER
jgi:hypothetical protein